MRTTTLRTQLALLLSLFSLLLAGGILLAVSLSFDKGFHSYLNRAAELHYQRLAQRMSQELESDPRLWQRLLNHPRAFDDWFDERGGQRRPPREHGGDDAGDRPPPPENAPPPRWAGDRHGPPGRPPDRRGGPDHRPPPPPPPASGSPGHPPPVWLLDAQGQTLRGPSLPPDERIDALLKAPILREGGVVGYLAWRPVRALDDETDRVFARQQQLLFGAVAVIGVLVSVLVAWPLARYLVTPVQRLSRAARALSQRRYDVRVPEEYRNELGQLGRDFNRMALALGEHDSQQRQWLADVAHELRTPLGVMRGEIEAMQDGVMPRDDASLGSLHDEVSQLSRLVDDLHQLSITQSSALRYQFEPLEVSAFIVGLTDRFSGLAGRAGLRFTTSLPATPVMIRADRQRLEQLLLNLVQNSVRYTDAGGEIRVSVEPDTATLVWEDSAPGVDARDLEHLFDRFYRVEKSRHRAIAGSGLGLSIVANIARAHQAHIQATASSLGGLRIMIRFQKAE